MLFHDYLSKVWQQRFAHIEDDNTHIQYITVLFFSKPLEDCNDLTFSIDLR